MQRLGAQNLWGKPIPESCARSECTMQPGDICTQYHTMSLPASEPLRDAFVFALRNMQQFYWCVLRLKNAGH